MSVLLIATTNAGKRREVETILDGLAVELIGLDSLEPIDPPEETGKTFEDNARLKACHYARHTGHWTLADDSGLEVDALDGEPGVRSSRFAGPQASDDDNNRLLLARLRDVPPSQRTARFHCCAVLASPAGVAATAHGCVEGCILDHPRGENGFGYDPIFFIESLGRTAAELSAQEKNRISHRGRAVRKLRPAIERFVLGGAGSGL